MSIIYKITNIQTGKMYVGQTKKLLNERFESHVAAARTCDTYLYRAFAKYGISNFSIEVIECVSDDELDTREQHWIDALNTLAPFGYNMTIGGTGGDTSTSPQYIVGMNNRRSYAGDGNPNYGKRGEQSPNFGSRRTDEQLANLKTGTLNSWNQADDRRQSASRRVSGQNNPMFGRTPPNAKPVDFNGKIYDSLSDAVRSTGRSAQYIKKHGKVLDEQEK